MNQYTRLMRLLRAVLHQRLRFHPSSFILHPSLKGTAVKRNQLLFVLVAGLVSAGYVCADSIWQRGVPNSAYLFVDTSRRRVGDLLTIAVQETTGIDDNDQHQMEKDTNTSGLFNFNGSTTGNKTSPVAAAAFTAQAGSSRSFNGSAKYTSDRNFTDNMTVMVIEVQPNGNLVIEGFRRRMVNKEERVLRVSGLVRPMDIGPGNIVQSQYIANFHIRLRWQGS